MKSFEVEFTVLPEYLILSPFFLDSSNSSSDGDKCSVTALCVVICGGPVDMSVGILLGFRLRRSARNSRRSARERPFVPNLCELDNSLFLTSIVYIPTHILSSSVLGLAKY